MVQKRNNGRNKKKVERLDIRISGSGGQGIISAGIILGEAIAIIDGRNVSQSQSYGPEARGGAARSDIIVSDGEIYYPECDNIDILIAFTYEAYEKYAAQVKSDGLVIVDGKAIDVILGTAKTVKVPFMQIAEEKFASPIVANILALGFFSTFTKIASRHSLLDVIKQKFEGSKHMDVNLKALEEGFKLGAKRLKKV